MPEPRAELQRLLRAEFKIVAGLADSDLARLEELIQDARRQQRDALVKAQEHALRFVPALLRKPLLKLFTG
jgi:hypothetical protein